MTKGPAAPASGTMLNSGPNPGPLSIGDATEGDPEIAALLDFEPVTRAYKQKGAWTPELQRLFIARLAVTGSVNKACDDLCKDPGGARRLYKAPGAESFRAAAEAAEALWERRNVPPPGPFIGNMPGPGRRRDRAAAISLPLPSQSDDGQAMMRMAEEAAERIAKKLLGCRRLYLQEIAGSPGKRAAFEILTELPIDWKKAKKLEPQPDEPWNRANQRQADMVLTAESGWTFGEIGYGPDRKAEMRRALNEHRAKKGLEPVDWSEEPERESPA